MPYKVYLHDENTNIIRIDLIKPHTADEIPHIHQQTASLAQKLEGTIYRLVNMSDSGLTFPEMVYALAEGSKKREGSAADDRFKSFYVVGDDKMAQMLTSSLSQRQYGSLQVNVSGSVEEALAQINSE